jgi:ethanolamine permease
MISYIALAKKRPDLPRPYKSPLGTTGAWIGTILALMSLVATFAIPSNRPGVWGTLIFVVVMYVYYFAYSRNHLVAQAPEEEIALMNEAQKELK